MLSARPFMPRHYHVPVQNHPAEQAELQVQWLVLPISGLDDRCRMLMRICVA